VFVKNILYLRKKEIFQYTLAVVFQILVLILQIKKMVI